ncbi:MULTISPECIES: phage terminase large subunit family protein [unclassified Paenibacillus]|uniref:phage terminase large subunit family protein n=1 Tax=unclassified Paenibacillus TaxID=185978 RepID=UPI002405AC34|nr:MULTISPECIES: phage terminase large subunit family protein [unclassified Paenibacillus]MDF9845547.1 phage terminase large subunit GpA-like protein [Paenibacillus sp. PastF-2]MDF9852123.1 phage terminase large subunit GpA-like protein [Paenibacillus sp. PastM-2]MDF9858704.1 phage terminase large subunit GpA-like protein [Paenibacillus sp. PastF-1]MDH6483960.1 phage terminase large subunit GpA-like protein [Paenibacillus sp. PastH-2]MDH6511339.1 phage terminase large subunit GpA-like protein 
MIPKKTADLFKEIAKLWEPCPPLKVSEWADQNRVLSPEASAEPGPWRTDRVPYMKEVMDAINDPHIEEIAIMASAQVAKTEVLLNAVGYFADQEPGPIIYMLPDKGLIKAASQERITPMINASPRLKKVFAAAKGRSASNTIAKKSFPGGYVALVGANSPAALSSRPVRVVIGDEVDRFPVSAGTEGDPVDLVKKRTTTFHNRKHIFVSTPLVEETSRINKLYQDSTQEQWCLPCPCCGDLQALGFQSLKFTRFDDGEVENVEAACRACGGISSEKDWKSGTGQWVARQKHPFRRGFHLNQIVSPWVTWKKIVSGFLEAKDDPEMLQVWTNTVMGETWRVTGEKLDESELMQRGEIYEADVPDGVKILTATVDTQDNRFEIEVKGWGAGRESWGIRFHVIHGDLEQPKIWADLDEFLQRRWKDKHGRSFPIVGAFIDSGGHFTGSVYKFCAARLGRRIYAIKGEGKENGGYVPLYNGYSNNNRYKATVIRVGVDEGKYRASSDLKRKRYGPGYCHFPANQPGHDNRGYNEEYFLGLTAETLVTKKKMGVTYQIWQPIRKRNEPFDLHVYQLALIELLSPDLDEMLPMAAGESVQAQPAVKPGRRRGTNSSV